MTYEERMGIRFLVSQRRRELVGAPRCPINEGSRMGYRKGCRCTGCRAASATARREVARRAGRPAQKRYEDAYAA